MRVRSYWAVIVMMGETDMDGDGALIEKSMNPVNAASDAIVVTRAG
jgi:hypothetical protein